MKLLLVIIFIMRTVRGDPEYIINALKSSECTNCQPFANNLGWFDPENDNPVLDAAAAGYDTSYNDDAVCVVKVKQQEPLVYSLIERSVNAGGAGRNKYITNTGNCGVCSDLHSLGVYIDNLPTLERKLFGCGVAALTFLLSDPTFAPDCNGINKFACINEMARDDFESFYLNTVSGYSKLSTVLTTLRGCIQVTTGLKGDCLEAWKWSVFNTGLLCGFLCLQTGAAQKPNNVPQTCDLPPVTNFCDPAVCGTTVNGQPSCYPESYLDDGIVQCAPYDGFRLNSCLQCEECNNAYYMNVIMGRIRRTSGLESQIKRPDSLVPDIEHLYGLQPQP
jgi:hypothetical protein